MSFLNFFFFILFSYLSGNLYKYVWNKYHLLKTIPTGFGFIIMIQALFLFLLNFGDVDNINLYLIYLIFFLSFVYWFDDLIGLSALLRLFIQFFLGFGISYIFLEPLGTFENYLYLTTIFFGFSGIVLCNVINFYDGLDLNVTTLILIFCFVLVQFMNLQAEYHLIGLIISSFMIGFALFNFMPNNIFFGDAGCFAFASFINLILIQSLINLDIQSVIFLFIPLALPIIDVGYVILLRLKLKESLLTRNYHHLYHIIELKYRNKLYLVPQVINLLLLLSLTHFINFYSVYNITVFILLSVVLTLLNYFLIRFNIKSKR